MILSCALCHTRYLIPATAFAQGPRKVRCARCSHGWTVDLPSNIDVIPPEPAPPEIATPQPGASSMAPPPLPPPLPPGSNLPALPGRPWPRWLKIAARTAAVIFAIALISWIILARATIVKQWPWTSHFYDAIHMHVYYLGEGLSLIEVRSELHYEDGITKLKVEGTILNATDKSQPVPNMQAAAIGPDGELLQSWQIDAPAARVDARGKLPFLSEINAPKGTVVNINLTFIEPADDRE